MLERLKRRRNDPKRVEKRKKRREGIAKLVGLAAGYMFNTRMVGWVAVIVAAVAGVILLMRLI